MLGVQAGGDRQTLHEVVRSESMQVHASVGAGGPNDLLARLSGHPAFHAVPAAALRAELEPARYTGRSESQVREFLQEMLHPILGRAGALAATAESVEVRV